MKRIQITISAPWPTGETLDDHVARGDAAKLMRAVRADLAGRFPPTDSFAYSEPEIIDTRAPRSDKGKTRASKLPQVPPQHQSLDTQLRDGDGDAPALASDFVAVSDNPADADNREAGPAQSEFPDIPQDLRRTA